MLAKSREFPASISLQRCATATELKHGSDLLEAAIVAEARKVVATFKGEGKAVVPCVRVGLSLTDMVDIAQGTGSILAHFSCASDKSTSRGSSGGGANGNGAPCIRSSSGNIPQSCTPGRKRLPVDENKRRANSKQAKIGFFVDRLPRGGVVNASRLEEQEVRSRGDGGSLLGKNCEVYTNQEILRCDREGCGITFMDFDQWQSHHDMHLAQEFQRMENNASLARTTETSPQSLRTKSGPTKITSFFSSSFSTQKGCL